DERNPRPMKRGKPSLAPEFTRRIEPDLAFTRLPDVDGYAPQVGFSNGFPVGRNPRTGETWLAHCYGMVGAGRDNADTSGSGAELYAVTGHAPRHLDRNITLLGRVVHGMPLLSTLPRGTGPLGFYEQAGQRVPIKSVRIAADVAVAERTGLEIIRTDTPVFAALVEALRNRGGTWYKVPAGHIELCNVPIAVRALPVAAKLKN
ncbi:MAG: peptidylprolyl isomerase, partial [Betaproteobacteria bacterium]